MSLTREDVDARNYTYVAVISQNGFEYFLVSSRFRARALELAKIYTHNRGLVLRSWTDNDYGAVEGNYILYPRNYVKKARILYEEGKYL